MTKVANEDFVVAWTRARTIDDVVEATHMKKDTAKARAKFLIRKGVKLKKLERTSNSRLDALDIAQLNSLLKKYSS